MTTTVVVFVAYFAAVFALGVWGARRTRDESDYWIAGGRLGWLLGGATLAATHASAGTFVGTIGVIHTTGWSFAWLVLSIPIAYAFLAMVLAPRFARVRQLTLPSYLEHRYDSKRVRALGAAIILVATVVYIQAQIVAGGLIANVVLGVPVRWGMTVFTVVLIVYTVLGGMIAVVYTDLLQLVVMTLGSLLAAPFVVRQLGGLDATLAFAQASNPMAFRWDSMPAALLFTMGLAFTLGSIATPEKLVRLYAMRDLRTIRRGVLVAILAATGMNLMVFLIALAAISLFPNLPSGDLAMPLVATTVLPPVLGSLLLAAVVAAMMSTVDSLLLVAGSALAHDLWKNLIRPDSSPASAVALGRLGVVLCGVAPLVLLLSGVGEGELVQFIVLLFTALMAASFFAPVVIGVYWRGASAAGAAAAMVGGAAATFAWKAFGDGSLDPVMPGLACSIVLFVLVSRLTTPPPGEILEAYFGDVGGAPRAR